ncbi:HAMP domain-containing histidine kinase [Thermobifida halotolerans]|uniref:histidine kinase n=1 Tax=Thermobifida halotolerans TaxID=483545 RepID=A0A399G3M9_9ACTN|nr:HAMP domain-containing sensor histidine kinase [Thermobifida halotolerans]UOE17760.1 HAMP domain-containing histidine kinase [Thermobifida halotolerans]
MTASTPRPRGLFSLRLRLISALTVMALVSTLLASGIGSVLFHRALMQQAQDTALEQVRQVLTHQVPPALVNPSLDPESVPQQPLEELALELRRRTQGQALILVEDTVRVSSGARIEDVPPNLRDLAETGIGCQRVTIEGRPWLVVGTRVHIADADGGARQSPLRVFVFVSLSAQEAQISRLQGSLARAGGSAFVAAVVVGALLASSVLRPVRRLRDAARRLGEGHLDTRIEARGGDELSELARTFNRSAATLQANMEELRRLESQARRFAADVSHELRTPLTSLTALIDVLEDEARQMPPDAGTAARIIAEETRRLRRLVEDLLEISRLDAGVSALNPDEIAVREALWECVRARGWAERVEIRADPELRASVDPRRFDVILSNLVGNALRHGAPPVTVTARLDTARTPPVLEVRVRDRGPGIAPELLTDVFERFVKADTARSGGAGSGLGLSIAHANAVLHKGTLTAHNDRGAVFTLLLPQPVKENR